MKTLLIVPHMDDEAISCGGLILKRVKQNGPGSVVVMTCFGRKYNYGEGDQHEQEQHDHFREAQKVLGYTTSYHERFEEGEPARVGYYSLLHRIEMALLKVDPTEVVIPASTDLNQDHRHLHDVCLIALRPANLKSVRRIICAHGVDGIPPAANWLLPMHEEQFGRKWQAIQCYEREMREGTHPRSYENMRARARVLGSRVGVEFAEPYTLLMERLE